MDRHTPTDQSDVSRSTRPILRIAGLSFLAITALLLTGYLLFARYNFEILYSDLSIADASLIAKELDGQEIRYRIGDQGTAISVPRRDLEKTRLAIFNADGRNRGLTGFELFNESEMGLTDFAQKIKFQRAIQGELSRTIMMIDGVRSARVHIAIPERSVFRHELAIAKAAVTLIPEEGYSFTSTAVLGVQRLVASAVPGLALDHVTVVDRTGRVISDTATNPSSASPTETIDTSSGPDRFSDKTLTPQVAASQDVPVSGLSTATETVMPQTAKLGAAQMDIVADFQNASQPRLQARQAADPHLSGYSDMETVRDRPPMTFAGLETPLAFGLAGLIGLFILIMVGWFMARRRRGLKPDERRSFKDELTEALKQLEPGGSHAG